MYNRDVVERLVEFINSRKSLDKKQLALQIQNSFSLTKDRSVYYSETFAIRFCVASSSRFSNTVLSLSTLRRYDNIPFIVCVVTQKDNYMFLANATFLKKISHSSKELRVNNIRGSFNGSDILRSFEGLENTPKNFEELFNSHLNYTFEENLERLVETTNNIVPRRARFAPSDSQMNCIMDSIDRAISFLKSKEYEILDKDLSQRVREAETAIAVAAFIDNVNIRGRVIEYLITGEKVLKSALIDCLTRGKSLPEFYTADGLGDYHRSFDNYITETDIKTKVLFLSSCPKGYNIDKVFEFLAEPKSIYLVYVVAIDENKTIKTRLCSMYNKQLLDGTRIIHHWAGRSSRGVTQYDGSKLIEIVNDLDKTINIKDAQEFIKKCFAE